MRERRAPGDSGIVRRLRAGGPITAATLRDAEPETAWRDRTVIPFARLHGWRHYFTQRSDSSPAGFLDLVLCRPPRLLIVELKAEHGRPTAAQRCWLALLADCPGVEVYLWRPRDWIEIQEVLM
jgi:hypothetical protein